MDSTLERVVISCIMIHRRFVIGITAFHALVNTIYLVRFVGVWSPEPVVYGYVPWFMSFAIVNTVFTVFAWLLLVALLMRKDKLATVTGLLVAGGLIFHALNSFMFGFYSGSFQALTTFNAIFEIAVYLYGLALASFYIYCFSRTPKERGD